MPSRVEAFGIVVLEAWRAGTPAIVTSNGGTREFMDDGVTGHRRRPERHCPSSRRRSTASSLTRTSATIDRGCGRAASGAFAWTEIRGAVRRDLRSRDLPGRSDVERGLLTWSRSSGTSRCSPPSRGTRYGGAISTLPYVSSVWGWQSASSSSVPRVEAAPSLGRSSRSPGSASSRPTLSSARPRGSRLLAGGEIRNRFLTRCRRALDQRCRSSVCAAFARGLPSMYDVTDDWRAARLTSTDRSRLVAAEDALVARGEDDRLQRGAARPLARALRRHRDGDPQRRRRRGPRCRPTTPISPGRARTPCMSEHCTTSGSTSAA